MGQVMQWIPLLPRGAVVLALANRCQPPYICLPIWDAAGIEYIMANVTHHDCGAREKLYPRSHSDAHGIVTRSRSIWPTSTPSLTKRFILCSQKYLCSGGTHVRYYGSIRKKAKARCSRSR